MYSFVVRVYGVLLVQDGMNMRQSGEVMAARGAAGVPEQFGPDEPDIEAAFPGQVLYTRTAIQNFRCRALD